MITLKLSDEEAKALELVLWSLPMQMSVLPVNCGEYGEEVYKDLKEAGVTESTYWDTSFGLWRRLRTAQR